MSINVTVSSTAAGVSVSGGTAVGITLSGGIGPAGFLVAPGTATNAFGTFQLKAGEGITISTSAAQFQIASYGTTAVSSFAPVQSVAGRTGAVVLQAADVTAGTFAIGRIPTISYTALSNVPATFTPAAHTHSTSDVVSFTAAASAAAPVRSVAGRTGVISLAAADVSGLAAVATSGSYTSLSNVPTTFAPSAHTHSTADVVGLTAAASAAAPVQSVHGRTGAVVLTRADITAAAASHTHTTTDIASFTAAAAAAAPVQSVAGRIGAITLAAADVSGLAAVATSGSYTSLSNIPATFAPAAHTHSTTDITGLTATFSQVGHTHDYAASIHTHSTADITGYSALPSQGGKAGPLVTDGTSAAWATRYSVVDPVLVEGGGMLLTRDTSAGSITIAFAGGTSGVVVSSATPQPLGTAAAGSSADASRADHVHAMPTAAQVGAAAASHTHTTTDVVSFTAAAASAAPVQSVQGRTGTVVLTRADITAAASIHTHTTSDITGYTLTSLNGLSGTLTLAAGSNVTVTTAGSTITVAASGGGGGGGVSLGLGLALFG